MPGSSSSCSSASTRASTTSRICRCDSERDSRFTAHTLSLGGALVRNDLGVQLAEEGAECDLFGLFVGAGDQVLDNHTLVDHAVPHCTSRELYKGVLGGASRGVFRGRVIVRPDAQKTNAEQVSANLLLGDRAEVDTRPQLEIHADDVKCSHGSSIGQLDEDALFYLRARGLDEERARDLLCRAFGVELLENLPIPALGEGLDPLLLRRLSDARARGIAVSFDPRSAREDFPILSQTVHGTPLVFLDSAASAQKPRRVIDAISRVYEEDYANIHRGVYELSLRATAAFEGARETVARFMGVDAGEIVFVRNATEAINLVAQAWGRRNVVAGDEVLITHMEHHANIVPWQQLCEERGATLRVAPIDDRGQLLIDEFEKLLSPRTRIAALTHVSNALGTSIRWRSSSALRTRSACRCSSTGRRRCPTGA